MAAARSEIRGCLLGVLSGGGRIGEENFRDAKTAMAVVRSDMGLSNGMVMDM